MILISPSILSADFSRLGEEIESIRSADFLHFDVMDGVFVPNISFGMPVLRSVRLATEMPIDLHMMTARPARHVEMFAKAGADSVTVHYEADTPENIKRAIEIIHACGKKAGLALNPKTPASLLDEFLPDIETVLIMAVEPGFGGQKFIAETVPKIKEVRRMIDTGGYGCLIEIDGGINSETAEKAAGAGADILAAGSFVFKAADRELLIRKLQNL